MSGSVKKSSLFDDIFRLQSTAPDVDVDPEDPEDGFKASLAEHGEDETETVSSSFLRKRAAIISDNPKYKGKKTSRKDLYSDEESGSQEDLERSFDPGDSDVEDYDHAYGDDDSDGEESGSEDDEEKNGDMEDEDMSFSNENVAIDDAVTLPTTKSDDKEKGKAVYHQLEIWDDLIKSRIALQKVVSGCNRLPQPDTWGDFAENGSFRKEANNVHSSVRKLVSALLELQQHLSAGQKFEQKTKGEESDEEITSESEVEDEENTKKGLDEMEENEHVEMEEEENEDEIEIPTEKLNGIKKNKLKRKLSVGEVEETLAKRQKDFQSFRNDTLSKWDEKTRLTHGKIKAKNFAAFEMSVLKQIEQVLVNRERLVQRIHQQRSSHQVLGRVDTSAADDDVSGEEVDDDDEEVEMKQRKKSEVRLDHEIVDDSDFYHVCLRDLLESKQSEELDPVAASKQRLEIQRLRNKQKKKVDTRASKGRKIRYHVKEKLKNYMTPYDKSVWSDEQKDDLFKALFGRGLVQKKENQVDENLIINIGI